MPSLLFTALLSCFVLADAAKTRDVSPYLAPIRARHDVPALAAVVVDRGRVVARGDVGVRGHGRADEIEVGDAWHLGSCTKAITATVAARLVERGVLRFDTTLADVFAAGDSRRQIDASWGGVTLEMLLSNRSGAPIERDVPGLVAALRAPARTPRAARRVLLELVASRPPVSPPGTRYAYSNVGFAIAGHLLEERCDEPFERLVEREVFVPLGIVGAGFGAPGDRSGSRAIRGHGARSTPIAPGPFADNPPALSPAAGVHMPLDGWARFVAVHQGHGPRAYLDSATLERLHRGEEISALERYGGGWLSTRRAWATGPNDEDDGAVLHHTGTNRFWYCAVWIAVERDVAILVVCNRGGPSGRSAVDAAVHELIRRHGG